MAASLIVLGGDEALESLQQVITVMGLPVFVLVFAMVPMLIMAFREEPFVVRKGLVPAGEGVIVPHEDEGAIPERDEPVSRGTGPDRAP